MSIIQKLTLRHLKKNKRRTLVTIIGVIVSVAMVTAVLTLGISFMDSLVRQHIADNGEWHVKYENINPEQMTSIKQDDFTETFIISNEGYAKLEGSTNYYKPYIYFKNLNEAGLEQFPIELIEGRLPSSSSEVAISKDIIKNTEIPYEIGDTFTFDIGYRMSSYEDKQFNQTDVLERDESGIVEQLEIVETKTVTIVGVIERPIWEKAWSPGYTAIGYVDESSWDGNRKIDAYVTVPKVDTSIYNKVKTIADNYGVKKYSFNTELFRLLGVTENDRVRTTFYSIIAIVLSIIIIGSVALIYNAFAISVSERSRHLGMLSSVGATRKQKRDSVLFEGFVVGAISIPIGIISGLLGIYVTFMYINTSFSETLGLTEEFRVVVTPALLVLSSVISFVTILISAYIPARRASRISAIDAIRQIEDIKLSRKKVKTSKLVRKIFGLEAEIGLKNVKRNKKRYIATVFSLVVSIVLFLTMSFFTANMKKSIMITQGNINFDIVITSNQLSNEKLQSFASFDYVTDWTISEELLVETLFDYEELPSYYQESLEIYDGRNVKDQYLFSVLLTSLDEESFRNYAEEIGMNLKEGEEEQTAVLIDKINYIDHDTNKFVEAKAHDMKAGEEILLYNSVNDEEEDNELRAEYLSSLTIGKITTELPTGGQFLSYGVLNLIISEKAFEQIPNKGESQNLSLYLNSSNPKETQEAIENIGDTRIHVYNLEEDRHQLEQIISFMSIFTYGFIILISLIAIANIINTISTSITLRTKEFGMLRSVGMTPKGFNKMVNYESIFYGIKSLGYGLPISILIMYGMYRSLHYTFSYQFELPWMSILFVIFMIFLIVGITMFYSTRKIKKQNIIESLKQENI